MPDDPETRPSGDAPASPGSRTLFATLYDELRSLAEAYIRRERPGHTLQPTALVHEAYLKIARAPDRPWSDEREFYATAARVMRHILVDHARTRNRIKRGGDLPGGAGATPLSIAVVELQGPEHKPLDILLLDDAMTRLAEVDERKATIVELRVFAGLGEKEAADVLGVSRSTASEDWRMARAWLSRELKETAT